LNRGMVALIDQEMMESQFLGLVWRGGKIDHPSGEHDDFCNAAAGVVQRVAQGEIDLTALYGSGERMFEKETDWVDTHDYAYPMDAVLDNASRCTHKPT